MKLFRGFDLLILFAVLILSVLGLSMVWSLEPHLFPQQLIFIICGIVLFFLFSQTDFRIFEKIPYILYGVSLIFLILTFLLGEVTRGSVRWIQIGNFNLQPSEIVKPFLIVFFGLYLSGEEKLSFPRILKALIFLSFPLFLIFKQPDLGSSLVILASFLGILIGANISLVWLLCGVLAMVIFSPVVWFLLKEYQKARILSFLNPYLDPLGSGYHIIQSVITVGSGGLFGRGLGRGTQSHLAFLPEHHTDFIFASLSEELGFLGAMILVFFYFIILYRILKISQSSATFFGSLVCFGVFSLLIFQIFVNIGMNLGILPITGITLPLVSYGGSSIWATMISLGIVESVARSRRPEGTIEIR